MPGTRCTVAACNNSRVKTRELGIVYHNFPKNPQVRQIWVQCCRRGGKWNPSTSSICSEHFAEQDYERDLRNELLGLPIVKRLKTDAVPSLLLPNIKTETKSNIERRVTAKIKQEKEMVESLLNENGGVAVVKLESEDMGDRMNT